MYRTIVYRRSPEGDPYFRILVGPNYTQIHCCKVWCYKENPLAKTGWLAARPLQFGDGSVAEEGMGGDHRILSLAHLPNVCLPDTCKGFITFCRSWRWRQQQGANRKHFVQPLLPPHLSHLTDIRRHKLERKKREEVESSGAENCLSELENRHFSERDTAAEPFESFESGPFEYEYMCTCI